MMPSFHADYTTTTTTTNVMDYSAAITQLRGTLQEALLSQRGCALLRVCTASIQNVERSH